MSSSSPAPLAGSISPSDRAVVAARKIAEQVGTVLVGKERAVDLAVTALLASGHLLLEDVPGVGKTTLARALAASMGLEFRRLQFTSDLMPADVLGGNVFAQATGEFSFRKGPIFTQVLLADEINRTTPKTQSALLEAMDERRVSIDGTTHSLPEPFFVLATQNPQEFYGTFPLPESQLDRFLMRLRLGYPAPDIERQLLLRRGRDPVTKLNAIVTLQDLLDAQAAVDSVKMVDAVIDYLHALVLQTRQTPLLSIGVSTRGVLALERAVRAYALVQGRAYSLPDDVQAVAVAVLAHRVRIAGQGDGRASHMDAERIVVELLQNLPVPI